MKNNQVYQKLYSSGFILQLVIKFKVWFKWLVLYVRHAARDPIKCLKKYTKVILGTVQIGLHVGVNSETV